MYQNQVSKLYQPLAETLDKSMVRNPALELHRSRAYQLMGSTSRISRRMRSLSPEQASYIKSSTLIPLNKDLVPTDHLWKVRGKEFTAVNIEVKQGPPIPASALRVPANMPAGRITTETVYELRPKQSEIRNLTNTRSITNLRTVFPQRPPTIAVNQVSQVVRPQSTSVRKITEPVRISNAPSLMNDYQIQPIQSIQTVDRSNQVSATNRRNITDHKYNQEYQNPTNFGDAGNNYGLENNSKKKYKYNFFSALDEAVNTKCGSCGGNQIIASKPLSSWD